MLDVSELAARRGATQLFEGLSFRVQAGGAMVLRGPNGAGKTTLLRILCGLTQSDGGTIRWQGQVCRHGLRELAAYGGHQPALNQDLTVEQNLAFYAQLGGWPPGWPDVLDILDLDRCRDLEVRRLSAGQKRRAALARVLASGSPAWLLDEPFTNMDAAGRGFLEARIATHLAGGGMAIIAAHDDLDVRAADVATLVLGRH